MIAHLLEILRWVGIAAWVLVVLFYARSASRALTRNVQSNDPLSFLIVGQAVNAVWFYVARLASTDWQEIIRCAAYMFSIAIALGLVCVKSWYVERGR